MNLRWSDGETRAGLEGENNGMIEGRTEMGRSEV